MSKNPRPVSSRCRAQSLRQQAMSRRPSGVVMAWAMGSQLLQPRESKPVSVAEIVTMGRALTSNSMMSSNSPEKPDNLFPRAKVQPWSRCVGAGRKSLRQQAMSHRPVGVVMAWAMGSQLLQPRESKPVSVAEIVTMGRALTSNSMMSSNSPEKPDNLFHVQKSSPGPRCVGAGRNLFANKPCPIARGGGDGLGRWAPNYYNHVSQSQCQLQRL